MNRAAVVFTLVFAVMFCDSNPPEEGIIVHEASGVARMGNKILIVGDDADGRYFELPLPEPFAPIIPVDPRRVKEIPLPGAELAMDMESIDILADGRIVLLSENLASLIAQTDPARPGFGVVAEYKKDVSEFGNRGLEGLAVKQSESGDSRVAVLWEGGYPVYPLVPEQIRDRVGRYPMKPVIVVHDIPHEESAGLVTRPLHQILLNVPEPEGDVPYAQRYRGSDLVWHRWRNPGIRDTYEEGFIVLLMSENSPTTGPNQYAHKILQRFNLSGEPVGEPLDINPIGEKALDAFVRHPPETVDSGLLEHLRDVQEQLEKRNWQDANWEGLGWYREGQKLIMVFDKQRLDPPFALVVDIPDSWK